MNITPIKLSMYIIGTGALTVGMNVNQPNSIVSNKNNINNIIEDNICNDTDIPDSTYQIIPEYLMNSEYAKKCWNYRLFQNIDSLKIYPYKQSINLPVEEDYTSSEFIEKCDKLITPRGVEDEIALKSAPSPQFLLNGDMLNAKIVVDISRNILFYYDNNGVAIQAYKVATGKPSTPTHKGLRRVTHKESYPYLSAGKNTKRRKSPKSYGPKIICLEQIDTKTGKSSSIGEFIHGNNNSSSIGKHASHGCVRMDNDIIVELANQVKRGDYVIIQ